MDYKTQYQMYLSQASAALEDACAKFLPEESEVCRAARYSLLGGGKRIRAVLICPAWTTMTCGAVAPPATRHSGRQRPCWQEMCS